MPVPRIPWSIQSWNKMAQTRLACICGCVAVALAADSPLERVSLSDFNSGDAAARDAAVAGLRRAFEGQGMLEITDTGVPADVVERVIDRSRAFFAMPREFKVVARAAVPTERRG